jgi:hypothetical protein
MGREPTLKAIPDDELLRRLSEILESSRRVEADLIAHIAEVDERKLYAREATPSMFAYCTETLHLSEHEAFLRITVARASREHTELLTMLRDGRLHLSGICKLAPHLTADNREELLRRAVHKSKRQIEELVATLAPRPEAPAVIRKLPEQRAAIPDAAVLALHPDRADPSAPELDHDQVAALAEGLSSDQVGAGPGLTGLDQLAPTTAQLGPDRVGAPLQVRSAVVEPVGPARFRVRFDASAELRDKLERLQALMRSSVPDGDLGKVIEVAVTRELERLEAKHFAKTNKPRKSLDETDTTPKSRHIPAAVRRIVHERDGGRCTYEDKHGRRCTKRHDLEFHHREPFARGGEHSPEVVCLMCRTHNTLVAEQDYGKEVMARFRRSGSRVSEPRAMDRGGLAGRPRGCSPG